MNILCCNPPSGAFYYITESWGRTLRTLGHNFLKWDKSDRVLTKFKPDLYLGCSGHRQEFPKWARDQFGTKIGIHVNPYSDQKLPKFYGVDINEPENTIKWIIGQKPNFVYCYADQQGIQEFYSGYKSRHGIEIVPMSCAGDPILFYPTKQYPEFECELGFVGAYWPYKGYSLDKYLVPILDKFKSKIWGRDGWKVIQYQGKISDQNIKKVFSSAKVCPAICEPHTAKTGIDVPERIFKIPLGGGLAVSDPFTSLERYFSKGVIPVGKTAKELEELIRFFIENPEKAEDRKKIQRLEVARKHTYFSRFKKLFKMIGWNKESQKAQEKIDQLVEKIN